MKIYLVRHGETKWNLEKRMQGSYDSDLTDNGISEARILGEALKDVDFTAVYASPLGRAANTAKYIKKDRNIDIIYKDELKEMNFGIFEGKYYEEIEKNYAVDWDNFWNKPHLYKAIEGEEYLELIHRARSILSEIIKNHRDGKILVVTHTALIKAIYYVVKDLSLENFWQEPYIKNTCLSIIDVDEDKITFSLECDTSHIE
ncbi:MAG: histidine phosphatase family protein [Clostridium sp.]